MAVTSQIAARLRTEMAEAQARGWTISPGEYVNPRSLLCCPQGALLVNQGIRFLRPPTLEEFRERVGNLLGVTPAWCEAFEVGFDGAPFPDHLADHPSLTDAHKLGRDFRAAEDQFSNVTL